MGGEFSAVGGVSASRIARYDQASGAWSAMGTGVAGSGTAVQALATLSNGDVLASGKFNVTGGVLTNYIARYNPTSGAWSALESGLSAQGLGALPEARAIAVLASGDVLAGGTFSRAGGHVSAYFARYAFGAPAPSITNHPTAQNVCASDSATFSVTLSSTGPFTYQWRKGTVPIDAVTNPSAATATLTLTSVGPGDVASYDCVVTDTCGSITSNPGTLTIVTCCGPADIGQQGGVSGGDSTLDNNDFIVFIDWFFAGDPRADRGTTGGVPGTDGQFDNNDFIVFIDQFFAGC